MKLEGSIALVTGANGGLGKQLINGLQAAGAARIYAAARRVESLDELAKSDPARIIPVQIDVTKLDQVSRAATLCPDVNLLINNAGVTRDNGVISAPDIDSVRLEMDTNFFGTMAMCRAFSPILKANGGGAIVNIVSILGKINLPFMGTYCASKAAELSLTQCVRAELASQKTLVIAVMPGTVDTDFAKYYPPPKVAPAEVVKVALQAVIDENEDVYPGEQASYLADALLKDPKGLEKQLAGMLPEMLEQLKLQHQ